MSFSNIRKFSRALSLILVLCLMTALFAGCKKDDDQSNNNTSTGPNININLSDPDPTETQTQPTQTQPVEVNENMGTVTGQLNVRSTPSTDSILVGTLYAGDRVEVQQRQTVFGQEWAYIVSPQTGWIAMDYVEMDVEPEETTGNDTPDETTPDETTPEGNNNTQNIKGVVDTNDLNIRSEASTDGDILGSYNKGDVVTILETKDGWGRTSKGWIKMDYVTTKSTTDNSQNTDNATDNGNGSTEVQFKGIVTAKELNVRSKASMDSDKVGSLTYGARVEILEKSGNWGRTKDGWISLDYVYQDGTTGSKTANGIVTGSQLNIRSGPGTGYGSVGSLNSGDRVNILEQFTYDGTTWGCTKNGWISLDFVYIDGTDIGESKTGVITGDELNIRSGPGTGYGSVGKLNSGDTVEILYQLEVGDTAWGCIDKGWVSMEFVSLG